MSRQLSARADLTERYYEALFSTPDGERVLADLRERFYDCRIGEDFERAVGRRDVVLHILESMDHGGKRTD